MLIAYILLATVPGILLATLFINFFFTLKNSKSMSDIKGALEQLGTEIKDDLANLSGDIDNLQGQIATLEQKVKDATVIGGLSAEDAQEIQALFAGIKDTTAQLAARVPEAAPPSDPGA